MKKRSNKKIEDATNFDQLMEAKYGDIGLNARNKFEEESQRFFISEMLKDARKEAKLTQTELAIKIGTQKSYISKIKNGKGNITLETLIKIFETGLNRKVGITIS